MELFRVSGSFRHSKRSGASFSVAGENRNTASGVSPAR